MNGLFMVWERGSRAGRYNKLVSEKERKRMQIIESRIKSEQMTELRSYNHYTVDDYAAPALNHTNTHTLKYTSE